MSNVTGVKGWLPTLHKWVGLLIDDLSHAIISITQAHHAVHDGSFFTYTNAMELSNGQTISYVISVPDTTKYPHFGFIIDGENEFDLAIYEDATPDDDGTIVSNPPVINANRNSTNTNTLILTSSPTLGGGSKGSLMRRWHGGSGKSLSWKAGTEEESVLRKNTKYWIDVTNSSTSNSWISWQIGWYEYFPET